MPHRPRRCGAALVAVATLSFLPACALRGPGGDAPGAAGPPPSTATAPAGHRTVVERRLDGVALVVDVVEGPAGAAATWSGGAPGERRLLAEEVRIGTDVWVHLAMTEADGITEPAWIHIDLTEQWQREFLAANPLGLLEQRQFWDARTGDDVGGDEVVGVDRVSPTQRVLRLAGGGSVHVSRRALRRAPAIEPPDTLPVVPLRDVEELLAGR